MKKPIIIIHRINRVEDLKKIPEIYGVEIDVRHNPATDGLYLSHDPAESGEEYDDLELYLQNFKHKFIIFNIKEAGTEERCIVLAGKYKIPKENYFLLDVEFPYLYRASRSGVKEIAVRYSEAEPVEFALAQAGLVNWVWIDTNTILPLDQGAAVKLSPFKAALVSPDRWGRPEDIESYRRKIEELGMPLDAVMCSLSNAHFWE